MEETKAWYESKAVWGGLITVAAAIAGAFGVSIGADMQGQIVDYVVLGASAIGGLAAIYGRIRASKVIK